MSQLEPHRKSAENSDRVPSGVRSDDRRVPSKRPMSRNLVCDSLAGEALGSTIRDQTPWGHYRLGL